MDIERETQRLEETMLTPGAELNARLAALGTATIKTPVSLATLLRRPELSLDDVHSLGASCPSLPREVAAEIEIGVKYAGYIRRQEDSIDRVRHMEEAAIPQDLDYGQVQGLSVEVREKLLSRRPHSLGQASRIPGVTPAAVSILAIHLKRRATVMSPGTSEARGAS